MLIYPQNAEMTADAKIRKTTTKEGLFLHLKTRKTQKTQISIRVIRAIRGLDLPVPHVLSHYKR